MPPPSRSSRRRSRRRPDSRSTVFGAPPIVNYPTCVTAALAGEAVRLRRPQRVAPDRSGAWAASCASSTRIGTDSADEYTVFATARQPARRGLRRPDALRRRIRRSSRRCATPTATASPTRQRTLVRGLGFGLDFRGADHTTNGIELGHRRLALHRRRRLRRVKAVGRRRPRSPDARRRQRPRAAGRQRPRDLLARHAQRLRPGDRPGMNLFARGNTNDGGGWDIRLNHFVAGARLRLPVALPQLHRRGRCRRSPTTAAAPAPACSSSTMRGLPAPFGNTLYSVDWGRNADLPASADAEGRDVQGRPGDVPDDAAAERTSTIDGSSRLYVASWRGGQFRYGGENIGFIAAADTPRASRAPPVPELPAPPTRGWWSSSRRRTTSHRRFAQQTLLRRGPSPERPRSSRQRILARARLPGRLAAFSRSDSWPGARRMPRSIKAASRSRAARGAMRALADRPGVGNVRRRRLFVQALGDTDARVSSRP